MSKPISDHHQIHLDTHQHPIIPKPIPDLLRTHLALLQSSIFLLLHESCRHHIEPSSHHIAATNLFSSSRYYQPTLPGQIINSQTMPTKHLIDFASHLPRRLCFHLSFSSASYQLSSSIVLPGSINSPSCSKSVYEVLLFAVKKTIFLFIDREQ